MTASRNAALAGVRTDDKEAEAREALAGGNTRLALNRSLAALQAEAKKVRDADPARGALIDAQLAGWALATARSLAIHQPRRPPGHPRGAPRAAELLQVLAASQAHTRQQWGGK